MCKLSGEDSAEVDSEQILQVYSELDIPMDCPEVQIDINAFELFKLEPIEPVLDYFIDTPVHNHILASLLSIENIDISDSHHLCTDMDFYESFNDAIADLGIGEVIFGELMQVDAKLELPICLAEV